MSLLSFLVSIFPIILIGVYIYKMDKEKLTAKVIRIPARADVDLEVAENLIIELYSKN